MQRKLGASMNAKKHIPNTHVLQQKSLTGKKMHRTILILLLLFNVGPVSAGFTTGHELYGWFQEADKQDGSDWETGLFYGYVGGVFDAGHGQWFCTPAGVTRGQIAEIVKVFLRDHPGLLHLSATKLVTGALTLQFSCNK